MSNFKTGIFKFGGSTLFSLLIILLVLTFQNCAPDEVSKAESQPVVKVGDPARPLTPIANPSATPSTTCPSGQTMIGTQCLDQVRACAVANGNGTQALNTSGSYGNCTVSSCFANFHLDSNQCQSNTKSCSIANGSGIQTWNGSSYSACTVQACNSGFAQVGQSCLSTFVATSSHLELFLNSAFYNQEIVSSNASVSFPGPNSIEPVEGGAFLAGRQVIRLTFSSTLPDTNYKVYVDGSESSSILNKTTTFVDVYGPLHYGTARPAITVKYF